MEGRFNRVVEDVDFGDLVPVPEGATICQVHIRDAAFTSISVHAYLGNELMAEFVEIPIDFLNQTLPLTCTGKNFLIVPVAPGMWLEVEEGTPGTTTLDPLMVFVFQE